MYLQELLGHELFVAADAPHRVDHGLDVTEHLGGCDVGALLSECSRGLGFKQASRADLKAFDLRGGNRLGAQHQAGQRLCINQGAGFEVQAGDGGLGVRDVGRHRSFQDDRAPHKGIGHVGLVLAGLTVLARQAG
jgi:hypothetical protein